LIAALADGTSTLRGVLDSDDTAAMRRAVELLGATVSGDDVSTVVGTSGQIAPGPLSLDVAQSGATARFVLPALALGSGDYTLDGAPQLRERPMQDQVRALEALGVNIARGSNEAGLPLTVHSNRATFAPVEVDLSRSSQFASGLMIAAPLAGGIEMATPGAVVSRPYLELTAAVMRQFGAEVTIEPEMITVAPGSYRAAAVDIEPDASAASYFWALAAATNGDISTPGLGSESVQGDVRFARILESMGAQVDIEADSIRVRGRSLRGIAVNMVDCSDAVPTLAAIAGYADGDTTIGGVGFIRAKESDRIGRVVELLGRCGVSAVELEDGIRISPSAPLRAELPSYDDHRLAMAFSVLGLCGPGVDIIGSGCVAKTYPAFFGDVEKLRRDSRVESMPEEVVVIAIDGPAGSGKSTVARAVAERLGLEYLDTGAMYRSVAFAALRSRIDPDDVDRVAALARSVDLEVAQGVVTVDGVDATIEIRGPEVTQAVSLVASNPEVRAELRRRQRNWVRTHGGGVLEGRDIGSVVVPDATRKIYLTARPEVRALRRSKEVEAMDYDAVASDLAARDAADRNRSDGPLLDPESLGADDVEVVDTSDMTIDEVVAHIAEGVQR
jgi:3-phosphoshikimate 1-carboxyvinyltransferase